MVIYPSFWRIMHTSRYPQVLQKYIYIYTLIHILYLGEPSRNFDLKLPWHIYIHTNAWILSYLYSKDLTISPLSKFRFICQCYFFLANITYKALSFFTSLNFSQVDIINFPSCHLPQVNCCQNIILCSITKIGVQKQK